jgi:5-methyltetrahydropteroyltriglutamate--homocysteine methyltransferase
MFETTVAGSLPKPVWLAEPEKLWPAWRLEGDALAAAKIDATTLQDDNLSPGFAQLED